MRPCKYCGNALENRDVACPACGRDNSWPLPPSSAPEQPPAQSDDDLDDCMDLLIMDPRLLVGLVLLAIIGLGRFWYLESTASRHDQWLKQIQSGQAAPRLLKVMSVERNSPEVFVTVGDGENVEFRRELSASIPIEVNGKVTAYEFDGRYFVPAWDAQGNRSRHWGILAVTLTPSLLFLIYCFYRFRKVYHATAPQ